MPTKDRLVLFLGSGLSAELGLPLTSKLQDQLLAPIGIAPDVVRREAFISSVLARFWRDTFGWSRSRLTPSLEDHFTHIDLAANSGHYLGAGYGPKKLRALRRMTIHRVFKLLDIKPDIRDDLRMFVDKLCSTFEVSIVTTNWDIMAERCLQAAGIEFVYSGSVTDKHGFRVPPSGGLPLFKLHGSGNWGYCDLCQNLLTPTLDMGKVAVHFHWLLEPYDFRLFKGGSSIARELNPEFRNCIACPGRIAARVATFSYRKHLHVPFFESIWDEARNDMRLANRWLFVGYSMPEADIEIRHLLKTAQLARRTPRSLLVDVVLKGDGGIQDRYARFFGDGLTEMNDGGLGRWIANSLDRYCRRPSGN